MSERRNMGIYIQKFGKLGQRYFELDEIEYSPHSGDCIKVLNKQNGKEKTYVVINENVGDLRLHTRELMPRVHYKICDEKHLDNIYMYSHKQHIFFLFSLSPPLKIRVALSHP